MEEILSRIKSDTDHLSFLCGAGISVSSNMPTAKPFLAYLFSAMRNLIKHDPVCYQMSDALTPEDLRFEMIMSHYAMNFDSDLRILDIYGSETTPTFLHRFLAEIVRKNVTLITTNFDVLIEEACESHISCRQVVDDEQFGMYGHGVAVYKIHGTLLENKGGKWKRATSSICATIESVGRQGYVFSLSPNKKRFMNDIIRTKNMVVMGYSGLDDFDLSPMINNVYSEKVLIWIDHQDIEDVQIITGDALLGIDLPYLVRRICDKKSRQLSNIVLVRGKTKTVIKRLFGTDAAGIKDVEAPNSVDLDSHFKETFARTGIHDTDAYYFFAAMFDQLRNRKYAHAFLKKAVAKYRAENNRLMLSRSLNLLCSNMDESATLDECFEYANEAAEIDKKYYPEIYAISLCTISSLYEMAHDYKKAIEMCGLALGAVKYEADKNHYVAGFTNMMYGRLNFFAAEYEKARTYLLTARDHFRCSGYLLDEASCTMRLAMCTMEMGSYEESMIYLEETLDFYDGIRDLEKVGEVSHEIGILYQKMNRFEKSIEYFNKAIDVANKKNMKLKAAIGYYHVCVAEYNLGRIESSTLYEKKSSKLLLETDSEYYYGHNVLVQGLLEYSKGPEHFDKACKKFEEAIVISRKYNDIANIRNCEANIRLCSQ